jgi:hypothetical protein
MSGVVEVAADEQLGAAVDEAMSAAAQDGFAGAEAGFQPDPAVMSERPAGWQVARRLQASETSPVREVLGQSGIVAPWTEGLGGAVAAHADQMQGNF